MMQRSKNAGFASLEVLMAAAFLAVSIMSLIQGVVATHRVSRQLTEDNWTLDQSTTLMSRLTTATIGNGGSCSAGQIAELVALASEDTSNLYWGPSATLTEVQGSSPIRWEYEEGPPGQWEIVVDNDIDGDGTTYGPYEGTSDLLRVRVRFDDRTIMTRLVSRDPNT